MNVLMTMADTTARVLSHFNSLTMIETVEVRRRTRFGFCQKVRQTKGT